MLVPSAKQKKRHYGKTLPETGFIRLPQVLAVYPVSKSKLYADIKAGKFPAPVKLSERISAWIVEDIRKVLAEAGRIAA